MARWFHLGRSVTEVNDREIEQKMQDVVMDAFMSVCLSPSIPGIDFLLHKSRLKLVYELLYKYILLYSYDK